MSAAPVMTSESEPARQPRLALVRTPTASLSTLGFVAIIIAFITVGLGAVMVVSTSVGAQSRDLTALRREATQLGYKSAALESELQRASSANSLALRASGLGMVPNPYPAFINLADGSITGVPTPVKGNEMPFLSGTMQPALPSDKAPVTEAEPAADAQPDAAAQTDLTAAAAIEQEQP